jgi:hypothetical protein
MEETFPHKGILEKLTREMKSLVFYIGTNKLKPQTRHNPKKSNSVQQPKNVR